MNATQSKSAIDLKRYCGDADDGYHWEHPFVVGAFLYATNGHVCIRFPSIDPQTTLTSKIIRGSPNIGWPKPVPRDGRLVPWPMSDWIFEHRWESVGENDERIIAWFPSAETQAIGEADIDTKYHYLISLLPNARYLPGGGETDAIYFRFDGGEGLVMPMRKLR